MGGRYVNILGKICSPVALDLQLKRHALVLVHVLNLVHTEMVHLKVAQGQGAFVSCDYGKIDDAALPTLYRPSSYNCKNHGAVWRACAVRSSPVFSRM